MLDRLETILLSNWDGYNLPAPRPKKLSFVLSKRRKNLRFLAFRKGCRKPILFIKTARFKTENFLIRQEYEGASTFADSLKHNESIFQPRLVELMEINQRLIFCTEFVSGTELSTDIRDFPYTLSLLTDIIIDLGMSTKQEVNRHGENNDLALNIQREMDYYVSTVMPEDEDLKEKIENAMDMETLKKDLTITVLEHGDIGINNIVVSKDRKMHINDWEFSQAHGLPLYDLLYTVFHFFWYYHKEHCRACSSPEDRYGILTNCFIEKNRHSDLILEKIARYCEALKINMAIYPRVLLYIFIKLQNLVSRGVWAEKQYTFAEEVDAIVRNFKKFRYER